METGSGRKELDADSNWKFVKGDPKSAEAADFDDASWRTVNLPHDWSIEGTPDKDDPSGAGEGYFPGGIGWYRRAFTAPADWQGKQAAIEFDGVYMDATVYLNGEKLGTHPYGYTAFVFDLTPHLRISARNVLAVRVDNSAQPNSRWYSGSGIYRHVRLILTEPVHVAHWGVAVTTPEVSSDRATVVVRVRVSPVDGAAAIEVRTALVGPDGVTVGQAESAAPADESGEREVIQTIDAPRPSLWSPENPRLYRAVTQVASAGRVTDEVTTPFGIRSIAWSVEKGLALNGAPIKLRGGSVHHDHGPLGAAAFDRSEERKVELLKAAGFNAVRTAHNPPSRAFLDACDRLGLLVLDEPFDVWRQAKAKFDYARFFEEWWQADLTAMVLRDRNHPSIVMWGIGNEIPEVWSDRGAPIARKLASCVRALDGSRPLTQAFLGATFGANPDAAIAVVDIAGYNYNLAANGPGDHQRVPARIMQTTESLPPDAFEQWTLVNDNPHIVGEFVWTAMDYLGESGAGGWSYVTPEQTAMAATIEQYMRKSLPQMGADGQNPFAAMAAGGANEAAASARKLIFPGYPWHSAYCGDIDLAGFRKPWSFYRDILWNGGDRVFVTVRLPEPEGRKICAICWAVFPTLPSWTWPGQEGKPMQVEVYSKTEKVRLYLDGKQIGEMPTTRNDQFKATFTVPYAPGALKAVGLNGSRVVAEMTLTTADAPARLRLTADRSTIHADGQDLSFITVEALDAHGRFQPNAGQEVQFTIAGPGEIAALGNGDGQSLEPYRGSQRKLFHGRALVVVRASKKPGAVQLEASASGLAGATVTIAAQAVAPRPELA